MATYPNTALVDGEVDPPFGGQPGNRFGVPQNTFKDAQIRELERQMVEQVWTGRPVQNLVIVGGGLAGDAICFDVTGNSTGGEPVFCLLADIIYDPDVYPIVGVLVSPVSNLESGVVCLGGGYLAQSVTGLATGAGGPLTIDTTTGRLRLRAVGETTNGFLDLNGNSYLLALGVLP